MRIYIKGSDMNKKDWAKGIDQELSFWNNWLETKGSKWPEDYISRTDPDAELPDRLTKLISSTILAPRILDVGAGPMTILGKKIKGKPIDLTAVDALADEYDKLNFPNGLPLVRSQKCENEGLSDHFPADSFDLTYARNTLDHGYNPITAIKEMIKVTKPDGYIVTEHLANEAINENWTGFHQWNFYVVNRDIYISNKDETFSVAHAIAGLATIIELSPDHGWWISCIMRKV